MMKHNLKRFTKTERDCTFNEFASELIHNNKSYKCISNESIIKRMIINDRSLGSLHHGNMRVIQKIINDCLYELYLSMCENGDIIKLPFSCGYFMPIRYKNTSRKDYGGTNKLWYEHEESFVARRKLRFEDKVINAIAYQKGMRSGKMSLYSFRTCRGTLDDINKRDVVSYQYKHNIKFNLQ